MPKKSKFPSRPWPLLDQLSEAVELLHALVIWETYSDAGDRPTFVEVGGIELWGRCDELTAERSASAVLVEQLAIVRALVVETVDNYGADITSLENGLADRCSHEHLRPLIRGLFEGPR